MTKQKETQFNCRKNIFNTKAPLVSPRGCKVHHIKPNDFVATVPNVFCSLLLGTSAVSAQSAIITSSVMVKHVPVTLLELPIQFYF